VGKADFYTVVANYNNPESLKMAQKLVPDAYLNEVGGQQRIQLAWLDNLQKAQTLVKDLKNKGFAASIVTQD
jgi:cell division septation protein DedD